MKTKTPKTRKTTYKSVVIESTVNRGQIYCVNQNKNNTPYWGGEPCDTHTDHDGQIVQWVCSSCVAKMLPVSQKNVSPTIDPTTGEKRKRGRPKGSKNKVTKTKQEGKK